MQHFQHSNAYLDADDIDDINVSWHNGRMRVQLVNTVADSMTVTFSDTNAVSRFVLLLVEERARQVNLDQLTAKAATPRKRDAA